MKKHHLLTALMLLPLAFLVMAGTGCANYQKDTTSYERATPWVTEDGTELIEVTKFETSLNQERDFAELTIAVDSEYKFSPEGTLIEFTQPDSARGGGFYMSAVGYRTAVNVDAVNAMTDRDEAISDDATGALEDVANAVESIANPVPPISQPASD